MPYVEPRGTILEATFVEDVACLTVTFDRMDEGPVAPGGLYVDPKSSEERFQLHKQVEQLGLTFKFETYEPQQALPSVGQTLSYRGWWLPEAMDAALDTEADWQHNAFPDNGDHEHCLFTWATITSSVDEGFAWWSEKHGWISEQAYEDYIVNDKYRLRNPRRA